MAQAVFAEHPLEQYLQEAGETREFIPGTTPALVQELESVSLFSFAHDTTDSYDMTESDWEWRPQLLIQVLHNLETLVSTAQLTKPTNPFIERFKYNVISSSLLSPDLTPPHSARATPPRSIPGNLPHSRSSSQDSEQQQQQQQHPNGVPTSCSPDEAHYGLLSSFILVFSLLLSIGLTSLAILMLWAGLAWFYYLRMQGQTTKLDLTPCLDTLEELIATNSEWEAVVQDAVNALERDDHHHHSPNPSSHSPISSSLRVALHSTLQTTQTQCDNIRHLLSALTSPSDLSQLSEMYAPPSPTKSTHSFHDSQSLPLASPSHRRLRTTSIPSTTTIFTDSKRMTWNGPQPGFSYSSSSMTPVIKRRQKHRSDLSSLLANTPSFSAPVTPTPSSPLARVSENPEVEPLLDSFSQVDDNSFGAAALKLQRRRESNGLDILSSPAPSSSSHAHSPSLGVHRETNTRGTLSPASRFTTIHTSRQPLSSSGLHHALQAAMGAKRYTCAHLLALRFREEEEDGHYWEDVRSVMELLVGTLSDARARLQEAMGEVEVQKFWDQTPTPSGSPVGSPSPVIVRKLSESKSTITVGLGVERGEEERGREKEKEREKEKRQRQKRLSAMVVSFAPMPSHLNKFAAHVGAIQGSLEDAGGYLEKCVSALRGMEEGKPLSPRGDEEGEHPALDAYERLRRELGFALRECERGRNRLLDIVRPPTLFEVDDEEDSEGVPGLGHDSFSEESDVLLPYSNEGSLDGRKKDSVGVVGAADQGTRDTVDVDDVSRHLLLSADVEHLPPAHSGIEQVFEAESGMTEGVKREKTKLSREERIRLVKAKRESAAKGGLGLTVGVGPGMGLEPSPVIGHGEKWGPGGEVVEELKDVIWKVGEKRRQVQQTQSGEPAPSLLEAGVVSPPRRVSSLLAMRTSECI